MPLCLSMLLLLIEGPNCVALAYLKGILSQKIEIFALAEICIPKKIANLVFYKNWQLQNNQKEILKTL